MTSVISGSLCMYTNGVISGTRVAIVIVKNQLLKDPENQALLVCLKELSDELKQQENNLELQRQNYTRTLPKNGYGDPL